MQAGIQQQHHLENIVCTLFPGESILKNVKKETNVRNPISGKYLEFDCWIQNIHLAFEFQDPYHYITSRLSHLELDAIVQKDSIKREKALSQIETLLLIPCWWNGDIESLVATIKFARPDLLTDLDTHTPISLNPPIDFFEQHTVGMVPGVGTLMLASVPDSSSFSLAISMDNPWWLGEKYDGVRACWNPTLQQLYTRSGFEIDIPLPFVNSMNNVSEFLDTELWLGRGEYLDSQRIVQSLSHLVSWSFLRLISFDIPTSLHSPAPSPFESRYSLLLSIISSSHPWALIPSRFQCVSRTELAKRVSEIIAEGGEGVMLRKPESPYIHGRSSLLVKFKASRDDKEAIVVDIMEDHSLLLKTTDGIEFMVPIHDIHLSSSPVQKGDIVSFVCESYSRHAAPVRAEVYRVRYDRQWSDLVIESESSSNDTPALLDLRRVPTHELNMPSNKALGFHAKAKGHWTSSQNSNVRQFLINLARSLNLDPLVPSTWYSISRKDVESVDGGRVALGTMRGGFVKTVMNLFPNIGLDERNFDLRGNFWKTVNNQRKFFVDFANKFGFDAFNPANWYPIHNYKQMLLQEQGAKAVLGHYNERITDALVHLFPEIQFKRRLFIASRDKYYEDPNNRREFFINFATYKGFDAFTPENWYPISSQDVENVKGYRAVLSHYRSFPNALVRIFPNIGLDPTKFSIHSRYFWKGHSNRRRFFERIAKEKGLDPLQANNWYIFASDLPKYKGVKQMLENSGNQTIFNILLEVFPNIGLEEAKFNTNSKQKDEARQRRRTFFDKFAESHNFDPLVADNWYTVAPMELRNSPGAKVVLKAYNGSWRKALVDLYPEVGVRLDQFTQFPANHWLDLNNRRKFLEQLAEEKGLDPLLATTWSSITWKDVHERKGGASLLHYYKGNFTNALQHLFPDLK